MRVRPLATRVLLLGVFFILTAPKHMGFVAMMMLPFFACSWLYDIVMLIRKPEQRTALAMRIATWVLAFLAIAALNLYWYRESRAYANDVAAAVSSYKAKIGVYPASLEQVGIRERDARRKWRLLYWLHDEEPSLMYEAPFIVMDSYDYDFQTREWQYLSH
jgi:hypothetical protein